MSSCTVPAAKLMALPVRYIPGVNVTLVLGVAVQGPLNRPSTANPRLLAVCRLRLHCMRFNLGFGKGLKLRFKLRFKGLTPYPPFSIAMACPSARGTWFRAWVSGFGHESAGFGIRASVFGFRFSGIGFRVSGLSFWVSGFGFRKNHRRRVGNKHGCGQCQ